MKLRYKVDLRTDDDGDEIYICNSGLFHNEEGYASHFLSSRQGNYLYWELGDLVVFGCNEGEGETYEKIFNPGSQNLTP